MNVQSNVALALDGLEEGCRLIVGELNSVLAIRCPDLKVTADERKDSDSLSTARSKLRSSLPKLPLPDGMWIDTASWGLYSPWTLGYINGFENDPANVALVELYRNEVSRTIAWLNDQEDWSGMQWRKWIVEPVEQHHSAWANLLRECIPKMQKYSAGEDGFRRDAKIASLVNAGCSNEDTAAEIERLSVTEKWECIAPDHIRKRLTEYYAFTKESKPRRKGDRPKK